MSSTPLRSVVYGRQSRDKTKSIDEQTAECEADAQRQGWRVAARYSDGVSASRFATKARKDWPQLLAELDAGRFDVLVLWESSRGDRDAETWLGLLRRCRERGVLIRVTSHGHTYDMARGRDWRSLADDGIDSAYESEKISTRIRRGAAGAAVAGKPHGRCRYGYERLYDPTTGRLAGEREHPSQAPVVREIVRRVGRSEPIVTIAADLNGRGVPAPGGGRWHRSRVHYIAGSPAYAGWRVHRGERHRAAWPALVTEPEHLAAVRVLSDPARKTTRPGRQVWTLSYLARCEPCGAWLVRCDSRYACARGCVSINAPELDRLMLDIVARYLANDPRFVPPSDDAAAVAALAEVEGLRRRLDEWRDSAARGETSPASLARIEAQLTTDIKAAQRRAEQASTPAVLLDVLDGADHRYDVIRARLEALPAPGQRVIISCLLTIAVGPATRRASKAQPIDLDRLMLRWRD